MPSTLTPFCSIGGGRHASFQAKNPRAVCCPHCGQQFKPITDCVDLTEDDDEDAPTPTAVPTSRPNERRKLSSTIIPTNRSTSLPAGIENATLDAMARRQESIANTGRKDPIAIGVQATFWVGAGAYEYIGDIKTIEYSSAPKAVRKCMGNVSVVLHRDHGTHEAMVRYLVKQLELEQSKHAWEVVFSVEKGGSEPGPARLPERAYTTTRLYDLLRQTSTNFDKDIRSSKASLSFWRFFELDPLEMPKRRQAIIIKEHAGAPGLSKNVYIFQRVRSGRLTNERSAWELLSLIDQIHLWAITEFRTFVVDHLKLWHDFCGKNYLLDWPSIYDVKPELKQMRTFSEEVDLALPKWATLLNKDLQQKVQVRAQTYLSQALEQRRQQKGKGRCEMKSKWRCWTEECSTCQETYTSQAFLDHLRDLYHLPDLHHNPEHDLTQIKRCLEEGDETDEAIALVREPGSSGNEGLEINKKRSFLEDASSNSSSSSSSPP
ncbi:hypothetical protein B0J13DRAFT_640840 [Dactylonectria estremocensis]|uniref:Uncharacterized protein n=1 Tax=Dactylonectria estremocensis TaxID=1079267 RepID=A0A9P9EBN4_9HYPO|nr:hypothetical protein B0J13DRAFT_640840 [Dactylonectria estremocensis]